MFRLNRYSPDELHETGIRHLAVRFELLAGNLRLDGREERRETLSNRAQYAPVSPHDEQIAVG
jgi:hypothetical protein